MARFSENIAGSLVQPPEIRVDEFDEISSSKGGPNTKRVVFIPVELFHERGVVNLAKVVLAFGPVISGLNYRTGLLMQKICSYTALLLLFCAVVAFGGYISNGDLAIGGYSLIFLAGVTGLLINGLGILRSIIGFAFRRKQELYIAEVGGFSTELDLKLLSKVLFWLGIGELAIQTGLIKSILSFLGITPAKTNSMPRD